jgi:Malate synthase
VPRRLWPILKARRSYLSLASIRTDMIHADATSPSFANLLNGQVNLYDAVRRQIDFESGGKAYTLSENPAVLIVRYAYVCVLRFPKFNTAVM